MQCPITGKPCGKLKNIEVTQTINDKTTKVKLCQDCAIVSPFAVLEPLMSFLFNVFEPDEISPEEKQRQCPSCGSTLKTISKTSKIGCTECWNYFRGDLLSLIGRCQGGNVEHKGKVPKSWHLQSDIKLLEKELQQTIKEERYEEAAKIRDRIKELRQ